MRDVTVTAIATTPVKRLALHARERIGFGPLGASDNRCFSLIDSQHRLVNGKRIGELTVRLPRGELCFQMAPYEPMSS